MSNMNYDAFAQGRIQELSFNDVEAVNGGIWIGVGVAVVIVGLLAIGWERAHENAD